MSELTSNPSERPKIAEHYCITTLKEASTSMQWVINSFDLFRMYPSHILESCSFESNSGGVHTGTWKMKLVPKYSKKDTIGLFFTFSGNMANTFVEFEACLIDENGKEINKMQLSCEILHSDLGFDEFIKRDRLVDSLLPEGYLTIKGSITVIHMTSTQTKSGKLASGDTLSQDFCKLMEDEILTDAVLVCGDRKFPIHKCILAARSSVFSAMFTGEWKDHYSVEVKDMEPDILENLLSFIYTDDVVEFTTVEMTIRLLGEADKYRVLELDKLCRNYLMENISIHNIFEVAAAADLHGLNQVKTACINFMYEHGKEIILPGYFKDFYTVAPTYLLEAVLKKYFGGDSSQKEQLSSSISQASPIPQASSISQASPILPKQVTSCPSCDPSLHHCASVTAFQVAPDQPSAFTIPLPALKFPTFNFGQTFK